MLYTLHKLAKNHIFNLNTSNTNNQLRYLDEMNQYGWDEEDDPNGLDPK